MPMSDIALMAASSGRVRKLYDWTPIRTPSTRESIGPSAKRKRQPGQRDLPELSSRVHECSPFRMDVSQPGIPRLAHATAVRHALLARTVGAPIMDGERWRCIADAQWRRLVADMMEAAAMKRLLILACVAIGLNPGKATRAANEPLVLDVWPGRRWGTTDRSVRSVCGQRQKHRRKTRSGSRT